VNCPAVSGGDSRPGVVEVRSGSANSDAGIKKVTALLNWAKISPVRGEQTVRRPRRNHSAAFKAKVALEAIRGVPRRFVWKQVFIMYVDDAARWACGQVAWRPVHPEFVTYFAKSLIRLEASMIYKTTNRVRVGDR
jgi:hypothetical protein